MFRDMDSQALWGSEVFRSLASQELQREASNKANSELAEKNALNDFLEFQKRVNASVELKNKFKVMRNKLINDPAYRETINEDFVRGVMLLKFED